MYTETKYPDFEHIDRYRYNNKNRLRTMENDVADAIETAASTNNEGKEADSIPVELVDEEERFQDGYGDEGPRFRTCRPVPIQ